MKKNFRTKLINAGVACFVACLATACAADARFAFDASGCNIPEKFRNHPLFTEPVLGVNFGFCGKRGYYAARMDEPRKMKEMGVNWCVLKVHPCMETFSSRKVFFDPVFTVSETETAAMIRELHANGIRVMLQPCITLLDSSTMVSAFCFPEETEAQIEGRHPLYWREWFASFREALNVIAEFAEKNGVDALVVGCEYNKTLGQSGYWRETIRGVRERYSGPVSYESAGADPYDWLDELDFVCFSYWPHAAPYVAFESAEQWNALPDVPKDEMVRNIRAEVTETFLKLHQAAKGKPIVVTEAGMVSAHGWCRDAWNGMLPHEKGVRLDFEEQANYCDAEIEVYMSLPYVRGLCFWKWDEAQPRWSYSDDPMKDGGFRLYGKPAGKVFRRWADAVRDAGQSGASGKGAATPAAKLHRHLQDVAVSPSFYWGWTYPWFTHNDPKGDRSNAVVRNGAFEPKPLAETKLAAPAWREEERLAKKYGIQPAVCYFDLCYVTGTWRKPEYYAACRASMTAVIRKAWKDYGTTFVFSWHMDHPCTTNGFPESTYRFQCAEHKNVVKAIVAGEPWVRPWYDQRLADIAAFFDGLVDEKGQRIPVVLRYAHEMDGGWFWWGKDHCDPEDFIGLARLEADTLRARCGAGQILFAYTPDRWWNGLGEEGKSGYLRWYPGDAYVDLIGYDDYGIGGGKTPEERQKNFDSALGKMRTLSAYGAARGKVAFLCESGNPNSGFYYEDIRRLMTSEGVSAASFNSWIGPWTWPKMDAGMADLDRFVSCPEVKVIRQAK